MATMMEYDDSNFQALYRELGEKERVKALRGGFRAAANVFRKGVIGNVRSSIHSGPDLEKGVRALVFKQRLGFRVTVGTVSRKSRGHSKAVAKGYHTNRFGLEKPVLLWAEDGTKVRRTKGTKANRGAMKRYGFITKTKQQLSSSIEETVKDNLLRYVEKTARKYGCQ